MCVAAVGVCSTCVQPPAWLHMLHLCTGACLYVCAPHVKVSKEARQVPQIPLSHIKGAWT